MIYLKKKLSLWYGQRAQSQGLNPGEIYYFVLRRYAEKNGFQCDHPQSEHIIHEKGKKLFICNLCGFLFYKKIVKGIENGQIIEKTEIVPRIEEI